MIAAIYARKSTSQNGKSEEEKSVTRQVERAKAFAASKGWTVREEHIYVDDAISGAEFEARDGLMRLVASLKSKPPLSVLVVMDPDRLGREQCESPYWFKKINQAGVTIYDYLTGQEVRLDNPTDKLLISVSNFAAEMERVQASRRVKDTFLHKIDKGLVVGGKVFGYANVRTPEGVRREINPGEAPAVVQIFELCAQGFGYLRTAHRLNEEGHPSPGGRGWSSSSVRDVLHRSLYKGEIVWNKTAKKDRWGQRKVQRRPPDDWVHGPHAPELRIVDDELWERAHDRLRGSRDVYLRATRGQLWGKPGNGIESKYLLTGWRSAASAAGR